MVQSGVLVARGMEIYVQTFEWVDPYNISGWKGVREFSNGM